MNRLLCISLLALTLACRENASPESQAVTTAAAPTETTATTATTASTPPPAAPSAPAVNGPKLMPVDEATKDAALVAYREELLSAVRRRDGDAVITLSDPKIRTSFGGGGGAEDFRKALAQPGVWEDFEQVLTQGGSFVGEGETRSFWAPYVYSAWPEAHDAFEFLAITTDNVPLRESADANAKALATLSYDIVHRAGEPSREPRPWQQIKTSDDRTGWVESRFVRSPVGYRAGFVKSEGKWKLNALVAGD